MKVLSRLKVCIGMSGLDIERQVIEISKELELTNPTIGYNGYKHACCVSINKVACHGVPNAILLKEGDIVSVDVVTRDKNGLIDDACETYIIGKTSDRRSRLVHVARRATQIGIRAAKIGATLGEVADAINNYIDTTEFSVMKEFGGHYIGKEIHEEPLIPFIRNNSDHVLKSGDRFSIEPIIMGSKEYSCKILVDGWTVLCDTDSAQFERTIQL